MTSEDSALRQEDLTQRQAWALFLECFLLVLNPSHPEGIAIYAFVNRTLTQFHLRGLYDPLYILHEVYLRAFNLIWVKDERIRSLTPWIKATAFNVVRELSRKQRKTDSIEEVQHWEKASLSIEFEFNPNHEFTLIMLAYQRLLPEDQRILRLVLLDDFSYREIRAIYMAEGQEITEQTLRQKKTRALKRLRNNYHNLADHQDCCED
jgi:DNA-directed RNA polymerase specialized sigma24 family protein